MIMSETEEEIYPFASQLMKWDEMSVNNPPPSVDEIISLSYIHLHTFIFRSQNDKNPRNYSAFVHCSLDSLLWELKFKMKSATETTIDAKVSIEKKCAQVNFEEALRRTGFGKFNYFLVILSGAVLSTVLFETLGISFILPIAECDLNLTTADKGLLSAIAFLGIIASSHLWGFLADTKGRRKVIMPTLFISFGITIVSSFIKSYWIFTLLRFFSGLL